MSVSALVRLSVGDLCVMKKKHPCGHNCFKLTRVGADIKAVCQGCNREVYMPRSAFVKAIKSIESPLQDG